MSVFYILKMILGNIRLRMDRPNNQKLAVDSASEPAWPE